MQVDYMTDKEAAFFKVAYDHLSTTEEQGKVVFTSDDAMIGEKSFFPFFLALKVENI